MADFGGEPFVPSALARSRHAVQNALPLAPQLTLAGRNLSPE